jgi:glycosyltransferase involved in cell wall biosynthesis
VTVAVLVYVPYLSGYFEQRLNVLRLCLDSLLAHTDKPYDLLVFDNGSCQEVKEYLQSLVSSAAIQYLLTSSENIGKIGAFQIMFQAAPGELIAYADDDIFFYPGWLTAHLELVDQFPKIGMVSGCAVRTLFDHGIQSNLKLAEEDELVSLIRGQNIPEVWEVDWAESYGRDVQEHLEALQSMQDLQIERLGLRAFAVANHNQFVSSKEVVNRFLPQSWSGRLMGQMNELDNAIDSGGYLRLSTLERTTRHMGNRISPSMAEAAARLGLSAKASPIRFSDQRRRSVTRRMLQWKPVRWFLQGLYNRLFWFLSEQKGGWLNGEGSDKK